MKSQILVTASKLSTTHDGWTARVRDAWIKPELTAISLHEGDLKKPKATTTPQQRTMPALNFDGAYGNSYRTSIRDSVPGYDVLHEIALATVHSISSRAKSALVVGPGPGEQLPDLLKACPNAEITVLEPSEQMLSFCREAISRDPGRERCVLIQGELNHERVQTLNRNSWDLVVCHNVLHLFEAKEQVQLLRLLAQCTGRNGLLLLSGYSEPTDPSTMERMMEIGLQRLRDRDLSEQQVVAIRNTRNKVVFSVDSARVSTVLTSEELTPALQLYQGLFARLWASRRQGEGFTTAPAFQSLHGIKEGV